MIAKVHETHKLRNHTVWHIIPWKKIKIVEWNQNHKVDITLEFEFRKFIV